MAREVQLDLEETQTVMVKTKYFGDVECDENSIVLFPQGLPGFDDLTRFVCFEQPGYRPLVYLQSVEDPQICFLTLPVGAIDRSYKLDVDAAETALLQLQGEPPVVGANVLGLAILSTYRDQDATANLLSPVLINVTARIGMQVVQSRSQYDWRHPLTATQPAEAVCS
jgi:flagellar assembly factor FliW